jgi:hypothetical protein
MGYYLVVLLICVILNQCALASIETDDTEFVWSTETGNSQNTYRIVPSNATNYSKIPWTYEYNLTSQDVTQFGRGAGINGDVYFFLSETRSHPGKHRILACHIQYSHL